jgi:hypothetical protein
MYVIRKNTECKMEKRNVNCSVFIFFVSQIRLSGLLLFKINLKLWILETVGTTFFVGRLAIRKASTHKGQRKTEDMQDIHTSLKRYYLDYSVAR